MNQKDMNDEMEIDLLDLAYMLMDHWHHLLLCLLAGALALNAFAFFFIEPPMNQRQNFMWFQPLMIQLSI